MTNSMVRQDREARKKKGHETETMIDRLNKTQTKKNINPAIGAKISPRSAKDREIHLIMMNSEGCCLISTCKLNKGATWTTPGGGGFYTG